MSRLRESRFISTFQISSVFYETNEFIGLSKLRKETASDLDFIERHILILEKNHLLERGKHTRGIKTWRMTDEGRRIYKQLCVGFNIVRELGGLG
jgi:DNA-binding MarR family transcriptional regulator